MRKRTLFIIILAVVGIPVSVLFVYFALPGILMGREMRQLRARLLCETDHQALLNACRELSRKVVSGEMTAGVYKGSNILKLPEPIPSLKPNHVTVGTDGQVKIEMFVGWYPLGVRVYPDGFPNYPPPFKFGDRQLLEGLWYYDDGYRDGSDRYDKVIDRILKKRGKRGTKLGALTCEGETGIPGTPY